MRFSFKKTLALVLSVILVLSTFVGVLTTSAADATVVGTLTMEDVTVTANNDNTFAVPADITLTEEATYVEVAYQLGTLPEGVTLTSAALSTATDLEGSAVVDADKNVVHVSVPGPATTIPVVMTFTAANVLEAFELSITSVDYADVSEADKTITISDTAVITVAVHAVSDTMYSGDATYHWYTCTVDGCEDHKYYYDSKGVLHSGITWHSWIVDEKTAPTCSTAGVGYKYCSCGRVWGNVSIDATGEHDYSYLDNEDGATHTATCSVGGEVITDEAHTFVDGICSLCNAEEVCVHANTTSVVATPSDCINMGWTTYTCSDCGESWNAQDVAINPDVHTGNEATPIDKNDGTHDVPCADCSAIIRNESHTFVDGSCSCDAKEGPSIDTSLKSKLTSVTAQLSNSIGIYYRLNLYNVDMDDFEFVISKPKIDGKTYDTVKNEDGSIVYDEKVFSKSLGNYDSNSITNYNYFYLSYRDTAMYEMGNTITYTLYIINDGVRTSYYTWESTSLAQILQEAYDESKADGTKPNENKAALVVSLLKLGTAAQNHFAARGTEGNALSTWGDHTANVDTSLAPDYGDVTRFIHSGADDSTITPSIQLLETPALRYKFLNTSYKDPSKVISIKANYTSNALAADQTVRESNGSTLALDTADEGKYAAVGMYYFTFGKVALYDMTKVVTFTVEMADGATFTEETTLMTVVANNISATGTAGEVYKALAHLTVAAANMWPEY